MQVADKKVVALTYTLRESNEKGEILQQVDKDRPFVYLFGMGGLLPSFKAQLEGLKAGEKFSFTLPQEEAYGAPTMENVLDLDKKIFEIEGKIDESIVRVGEMVPMEDENGNPLTGTIVEIGDDKVKVDFNHPLAGMDLHFSGEVLDVREPTKEELEHGHVHGPGGVEH
jgi:FKBP-type peptidyl-prolyl cis-trans isomerase SlyD